MLLVAHNYAHVFLDAYAYGQVPTCVTGCVRVCTSIIGCAKVRKCVLDAYEHTHVLMDAHKYALCVYESQTSGISDPLGQKIWNTRPPPWLKIWNSITEEENLEFQHPL